MTKSPPPRAVCAVDDSDCPLIVDMDGTLLSTDTLYEGFLDIAHKNPTGLAKVVIALTKGKACFKQAVSGLAQIDVASLPVHEAFLA